MNPIKYAAKIVGSQRELARLLGVSPGRVTQWATTDRIIADYCPLIERATHGAVRCEDLRPDVDWAYLRATDCAASATPTPIETHQEAA